MSATAVSRKLLSYHALIYCRFKPLLLSFCRLHGELAAGGLRDSAAAVSRELLACYALVERLGRGVVYYGSARLRRESPHWGRAR